MKYMSPNSTTARKVYCILFTIMHVFKGARTPFKSFVRLDFPESSVLL